MKLTESVRPTTLSEVLGQPCLNALRGFVKAPYAECWLLEGPPGVGKSAAAMALAFDLKCDRGWPGMLYESAAEVGLDQAKELMKLLACSICCPAKPHFHLLILEEVERFSPQLQVFLKTALDPQCLPQRAIVVATSNDPNGLSGPLLQRFKRLQFDGGAKFASSANEKVQSIWDCTTNGQPLPNNWAQWGWDGDSFSLRLALDKMQMVFLERSA